MVVIFHTLYFYRTLKMRSTHGNWCEMFSYTTCHNFIYGISGAHSPSLHCWHGNASIYTEKCLKREKLRKDILSLIFVKDIHLEAPTNDWWFFFLRRIHIHIYEPYIISYPIVQHTENVEVMSKKQQQIFVYINWFSVQLVYHVKSNHSKCFYLCR